ncbi:hypothetical protein THIOSC15_3550005 [uncultured Thiomicrorhabdus sp.]
MSNKNKNVGLYAALIEQERLKTI